MEHPKLKPRGPDDRFSISMRRLLFACAALSACTPTATREIEAVTVGPTDYVEQGLPPDFSAEKVKADLEAAIVERFAAAALKRAQSAEAYVLTRHYQGLPPPPPPGAAEPLPIAAILIRERGAWLRGETGGNFRPLTSVQAEQWLAALSDPEPWKEPTFAYPTCTDAGATYLMVSVPNRPFLLRAANCATPKSERLGLTAINL
jgi:hypothetical protein